MKLSFVAVSGSLYCLWLLAMTVASAVVVSACDGLAASSSLRRGEEEIFVDNFSSSSSYQSLGCGTHDPSERVQLQMGISAVEWNKKRKNDELQKRRNLFAGRRDLSDVSYVIQTKFHVVQKNRENVGEVTSTQIRNGYMSSLNEAFEQTPFRFELLGDVSVIVDRDLYECSYANERPLKRTFFSSTATNKLRKDVLNVYLCDTYAAQGTYGFSSFPTQAGTIMDGVSAYSRAAPPFLHPK